MGFSALTFFGGAGVSGVVVALALALVSRVASAQPEDVPAIDLVWNAPVGCPAREFVRAELARALGPHKPTRRAAESVRIDVERSSDSDWTATVRIAAGGAESERALRAESCATIASAAAVITAVAVDGPLRESPTAPEPTRTRASNASADDVHRDAHRDSQVIVGAAGILDTATEPSLDLGLEGDLGWALRSGSFRVRVEASGALFESRAVGVVGRPGEGGTFSLTSGGVRTCGTALFEAFEVGPCLGGEVDFMTGSGTASQAGEGSGAWATVSGSALALWNVGRAFGVITRADAVLPFARPPFVITHVGAGDIVVHRPASATFRMAIGIEVRFF
jgi:hypothetical protein